MSSDFGKASLEIEDVHFIDDVCDRLKRELLRKDKIIETLKRNTTRSTGKEQRKDLHDAMRKILDLTAEVCQLKESILMDNHQDSSEHLMTENIDLKRRLDKQIAITNQQYDTFFDDMQHLTSKYESTATKLKTTKRRISDFEKERDNMLIALQDVTTKLRKEQLSSAQERQAVVNEVTRLKTELQQASATHDVAQRAVEEERNQILLQHITELKEKNECLQNENIEIRKRCGMSMLDTNANQQRLEGLLEDMTKQRDSAVAEKRLQCGLLDRKMDILREEHTKILEKQRSEFAIIQKAVDAAKIDQQPLHQKIRELQHDLHDAVSARELLQNRIEEVEQEQEVGIAALIRLESKNKELLEELHVSLTEQQTLRMKIKAIGQQRESAHRAQQQRAYRMMMDKFKNQSHRAIIAMDTTKNDTQTVDTHSRFFQTILGEMKQENAETDKDEKTEKSEALTLNSSIENPIGEFVNSQNSNPQSRRVKVQSLERELAVAMEGNMKEREAAFARECALQRKIVDLERNMEQYGKTIVGIVERTQIHDIADGLDTSPYIDESEQQLQTKINAALDQIDSVESKDHVPRGDIETGNMEGDVNA